MNAIPDHSVLRRRRTVEAGSLLSRGGGLLATVLFLAGALGMPAGIRDVPQVRLACAAGIVLMTVATVLAAVNLRHPDGRWYDRLSGMQVVGDTLALGGIVVTIQAYSDLTTWPLLAMPLLIASQRKRLTGALLAWTATSGMLIGAVLVHGDRAMRPGDVTVAVAGHLLIAVLTGTQSSAFGRQVTELTDIRRRLQHQATHDPLTGLPNRERLTAYAGEQDGRALAVLLLDLDGFKAVNDRLGHAAGDELLRVVAGRLVAGLREGDLAGRIGGDEFVMVLPGADRATAEGLADRLRAAIGRPLTDLPATVGVSIGVACRAPGEDTAFAALCAIADAAMYREKNARNRATPVPTP